MQLAQGPNGEVEAVTGLEDAEAAVEAERSQPRHERKRQAEDRDSERLQETTRAGCEPTSRKQPTQTASK